MKSLKETGVGWQSDSSDRASAYSKHEALNSNPSTTKEEG
jgi:hypothetical protein